MIEKLTFNCNGLKLANPLGPFGKAELTAIRGFEGLPLASALAQAQSSPVLLAILSSAPVTGTRRNAYVDVRVQYLKIGDLPHKPGWHCDSTLSGGDFLEEIHHLFVTGRACLTEFVGEAITLVVDGDLLPHKLVESLQGQIEEMSPAIVRVPSCQWVTYGPRDFHRVASASETELRLLVRIRETDLESHHDGLALEGDGRSVVEVVARYSPEGEASTEAIGRLQALLDAVVGAERLVSPFGTHLQAGFRAAPPPYATTWYGDLLLELARDRRWFASSLLTNSVFEANGAIKAARLHRALPRAVATLAGGQLLQHARDELKHSHYFLKLFAALPSIEVEGTLLQEIKGHLSAAKNEVESGSDDESPHSVTTALDLLIQINLGEIRTLIQVVLLREVVRVLLPGAAEQQLTEQLLVDEMRHICYSWDLIDSVIQIAEGESAAESLLELTKRRVIDLNVETLRETGGSAEGYRFTRIDETLIRLENTRPVNLEAIARTAVSGGA